MKLLHPKTAALVALLATATSHAAHAQAPRQETGPQPAAASRGPHGGTLKQAAGLQFETLVAPGGIHVHAYDSSGQPLAVARARGAVALRVEGAAKRYRYDLLPDGKNRLAAPVDLSKIAGRQVELELQLVGLPGSPRRPIRYTEVATVPASEQQLTAAAVARQKICPVSGKPLGSMGTPVAVDVNGQTIYACCQGCVDEIRSNPAKYAAGRPEITVTTATEADSAQIAQQGKCPVMDEPLGSMGQPIKVLVGGRPIFLCCKGCIKKIKAEPAKYLAMVYGEQPLPSDQESVSGESEQVRAGVFKVTAADAPYIAAQKRCPVMDEPLDAMGGPYRVHADGKAIYICCPGCAKKIAADPQKYLAMLAAEGVVAPTVR